LSAPTPPPSQTEPSTQTLKDRAVRTWQALFPGSAISFPGHAEWSAHVRIEAERIAAPRRLGFTTLMVAWWAFAPHPPGVQNGSVWALLVTGILLSVLSLVIARIRPGLFAKLPYTTAALDLMLITLIVHFSGGADSPFLAVFFLASAGVALRVQPAVALVMAVLYPLGFALATRPAGTLFNPVADFILTLATTFWSSRVMETRTAYLRDPLTGVVTRSHALFHLEQLSRRATEPFTVGLIDLDHFKTINDTYGHHAGDLVLQQYVRLIESGLRAQDMLARFGGDELLVVWTNLGVAEALPIAHRVRRIVEEAKIGLDEGREDIRVTVSIGLFEARPGIRPARLLRQVDKCLYASKRLRNDVTAVAAED
jgi:diguanylate cyclase (GGDEF)-like protein